MRLINVNKLAEDLRDNRVSEREKLHYLLLVYVLGALAGSSSGGLSALNDVRAMLGYVMAIIVWIIGLLVCFDENQRGDGRGFIERSVILGVPLSIRLYVLVIGGWYVLAALVNWSGAGDAWTEEQRWIAYTSIQIGVSLLTIKWLRQAIHIASSLPAPAQG